MFWQKRGKKHRLIVAERFVRQPARIKSQSLKSILFKILNVILLLAIGWGIYFFIFSDYYSITNIEVRGNQIISTDDLLDITNGYLKTKKIGLLPNGNIFLFNKKGLSREISKTVLLANLKVNKILPNTIRITLKEKNAAIDWETDNQLYLLDNDGYVIKKYYFQANVPKIFNLQAETSDKLPTNQQSVSQLLKIVNLANDKVNLGDKILNGEDVQFILDLKDKLRQDQGLAIKGFAVPNNYPRYLILNMDSDWQIFFNLVDSLDAQILRLQTIIKDKIKPENLKGLEYIDLRYGESIYYK